MDIVCPSCNKVNQSDLCTRCGCELGALFQIRRAAAEQLANEDPFHAHGDRAAQVMEWRAHRALRLEGPTIDDLNAMARAERP